jgi:hypothetical protein
LESVRAGEKRKSGVDEDEAVVIKKRRTDAGLEAGDNVVFMPFKERLAPLPPQVHDEEQFALLPDWKERFPERLDDNSPTRKGRQMPADMRRAAEAQDEEDEEEEGAEKVVAGEDEMDLDSDDEEDEDDTGAGIDQDVIMQVLRQKLADSGLGDVDESVFKDAIAKMLSGEGDGEDALGGLTSLLLGQKDGGGKAFEGFLAGQGVNMHREEEAEEEVENSGDDGKDGEDDGQEGGGAQISTQRAETTATPQTKTRPKTTSTTTATPTHTTAKVRGKSKATKSSTTTTTNTKSKPASPIVVPSPPPLSFKSSRKRRAPSLDEPALPQPEAPNNSAKPAAKRRRTPRAEPPTTEPEAALPVAPATGRRTTRSAAAAGKGGR